MPRHTRAHRQAIANLKCVRLKLTRSSIPHHDPHPLHTCTHVGYVETEKEYETGQSGRLIFEDDRKRALRKEMEVDYRTDRERERDKYVIVILLRASVSENSLEWESHCGRLLRPVLAVVSRLRLRTIRPLPDAYSASIR